MSDSHYTFDDDRTQDIIKQIYVDAVVASCSCFSANGIFNDGLTGSQTLRTMLSNSTKKIILADHTKANLQGLFLLSPWSSIDYLISDEQIDSSCSDIIKSYGTQIIF